MALSGSTDFTVNRDQIIDGAIRLLGGAANFKIETALARTEAAQAFNMLIKSLQAEGIGLWKRTEAALFLAKDGYSYSIGPTGDHATASYVKTEVATAGSSGDSSLVLDTISGISDGDYAGIELDDGSLQWTTIGGDPVTATIALDDVLTDDVAVDNHVYTYTTKLVRPVEILEMRLHRADGGEPEVEILSMSDYLNHYDKTTPGTISQVYYDPQLTNGVLKTWQACDDVQNWLMFTARIPFDDLDASTNNVDFPVMWLRPLKYLLAADIGPEYNVELELLHILRATARDAKLELMAHDIEKTSVFIEVE